MAARGQRGGDKSFATELTARMAAARVGVMELSRSAKVSKETIARILDGRTAVPTPTTLRKLDAGFAELEAVRALQSPATAVIVSQEDFDLFRQRVGYASSVAGQNARGIEAGHEKLDEMRQTLADLHADVVALREQVDGLRQDLASTVDPSGPVSRTGL